MSWLDPAQWVGFDVETSGTRPEFALQPWSDHAFLTSYATAERDEATGKISTEVFPVLGGGLTLATHPTDEIFDERIRYAIQTMLSYAITSKKYLLGWNVAFDASWLIKMGFRDEVMRVRWADAMLMWKHLTRIPESDIAKHKRKKYGLKEAVAEFLPKYAGYEDAIDFHSFEPDKVAERRKYNRLDAALTVQLARMFVTKLCARSRVNQRRALAIEMAALPLVADHYITGLTTDEEGLTNLGGRLTCERIDLSAKLTAHGLTPEVLASPIQLRAKLFDEWGLPVVKTTAKGVPSTDKDALYELSFLDPRIEIVQRYREIVGLKTKFVDNILASVQYNSDHRTHPTAIIGSTYCVPGDVEVLTFKDGWVPLHSWEGGTIAQVTGSSQTIQFLPAKRFIGPLNNEWIHVQHQKVDCLFTPGHTVPYIDQGGNWRKDEAHKAFSLSQLNIPLAGDWLGSPLHTKRQTRLLCAAHADGYFNPQGALKFTLVKERKKQRLRELLAAADVEWREYVCAVYPERTEFTVGKKNLPDWLTSQCKTLGAWTLSVYGAVFLQELVHWGGSRYADGGVKFSSAKEPDVDWILTLAAINGYKAGRHKPYVGKHGGTQYSCRISEKNPVAQIRPRHVTNVSKPMGAFCAETETGFWLARSNGKIFITGNTGRMTYASSVLKNKEKRQTGFAIHQMKRAPEYRRNITTPEGYGLCEWDAAGQEFRWCAIESNDPVMLSLCEPGEDAHAYMGSQMSDWDYRKLQHAAAHGDAEAKGVRQSGKVGNLSCQFRISPKSLLTTARTDYQLPWDLQMANKVHSTYHRTYKGVKRYWAHKIKEAKITGYAETLAGRRVQLDGNWHGPNAWQLESSAINFPIQGIGADQKYLAMMCIKPLLIKYDGYFYFELHDGLYAIFPLRKLEKAALAGRELLSNLPYYKAWGFDPPISLPWDLKMGVGKAQNWGDLKEVE